MIVARLDPHSGEVIDFMDWLDATPLPDLVREATSGELASLSVAPVPEPPSPRQWLQRLPLEQQMVMAAAVRANDTLFWWFMQASGSSTIDVTLPETIAGVGALVSAGILSDSDKDLLLSP